MRDSGHLPDFVAGPSARRADYPAASDVDICDCRLSLQLDNAGLLLTDQLIVRGDGVRCLGDIVGQGGTPEKGNKAAAWLVLAPARTEEANSNWPFVSKVMPTSDSEVMLLLVPV